jgi:hypothetical protein
MNERIKLLALQAGLRFTQLMSNPMVPVVDGKETDLEKFAELIVQECIDIIAPYSVRMSRSGEEYLHPIQEIKEHFRVEE